MTRYQGQAWRHQGLTRVRDQPSKQGLPRTDAEK
jgi:hypothetical protein